MAHRQVIATRTGRYGTRMLTAGEELTLSGPRAREMIALGRAEPKPEGRRRAKVVESAEPVQETIAEPTAEPVQEPVAEAEVTWTPAPALEAEVAEAPAVAEKATVAKKAPTRRRAAKK